MPATHLRSAFLPRQRGSMTVAIVFVVIVGLVLLGFAVVALLVGLSSQRRVARQAREGAAYANLKTGLLVEAVEGA